MASRSSRNADIIVISGLRWTSASGFRPRDLLLWLKQRTRSKASSPLRRSFCSPTDRTASETGSPALTCSASDGPCSVTTGRGTALSLSHPCFLHSVSTEQMMLLISVGFLCAIKLITSVCYFCHSAFGTLPTIVTARRRRLECQSLSVTGQWLQG